MLALHGVVVLVVGGFDKRRLMGLGRKCAFRYARSKGLVDKVVPLIGNGLELSPGYRRFYCEWTMALRSLMMAVLCLEEPVL